MFRVPLTLPRINLRGMLLLRLAGLLAVLVAIGTLCTFDLIHADQRTQSLVGDTLAPISSVGRMQSDLNNDFQALAHAVLMRLPSAADDAATAIKSNKVDIDRYWQPLLHSGLGAQQKQLLGLAADHRKDAEQAMDDTLQLLQAGQFDIAQLKLATDVQPDLVPLQSDFTNLFEAALAAGKTQAVAQHDADHHALIWLLLAFGIAVVLASLSDGLLIRLLGARLRLAASVAQRIARGELGHAIKVGRDDEIGAVLRALASMDEQLAKVVQQVRDDALEVRESAHHLAHNTQALSQRTQAQAASLEQTAASMEQMAASVAEAAGMAERASGVAAQSRQAAEQGQQVVTQTVAAMDAIDRSTQRIAEFVGLINDVAFQTNLLALNAAVEAARAGEHGRGFAVVANEVRSLAQRCSAAAQEVRASVAAAEDSLQEGRASAQRSGGALNGIVNNTAQVSEQVAGMALSGREQQSGIEQVSLAVAGMDGMTQQNAALVERTAGMSHAMRSSAERLLQQVAFFQLAGDQTADAEQAADTAANDHASPSTLRLDEAA